MTAGSSYTNVFGGNAVKPAQPSYEAITMAVTTALAWPLETAEGENVVAAQIDVTATATTLQLQMPPGNTGSTGVQTIITNVGAITFVVSDQAGNPIASIATTQSWIISLTDNSAPNGTWQALQLASTASSATAAELAGPGLSVTGAELQTNWVTVALTANTLITEAYRAEAIVWTGAAGTLQLDTIANLTAGWFCAITNEGTDLLTVSTSSGQTINGAATLSMESGNSGIIICAANGFNSFGALLGPLGVPNGGTGATTPTGALTNLGGTSIGQSIFTAPNAAAIIALLGLNNFTFQESTIAANQTLAAGSTNTIFVCTAALALTVPLTTTLTKQFVFLIYANGGAVTLTPQASDTINGGTEGSALVIPIGSSVMVITDAGGNIWTLFGPNVSANAVVTNGYDAGGAGVRLIDPTGTIGVIERNDGANFWLMITNAGTAEGDANTLRPFTINLNTGFVTIDETGAGVSFGGTISVAGAVLVTGSVNVDGGINVAGTIAAAGTITAEGLIVSSVGITDTGTLSVAAPSTFSSNVTIASTTPSLLIEGAVGNNRAVSFNTGTLERWGVYAENSSESGGNVGSNFDIGRFSDTGSFLDVPFSINRASGIAAVIHPFGNATFTVSTLPGVALSNVGNVAYATDGRNSGEGGGSGTGCTVQVQNKSGTATWCAVWSGVAVTN